MQSHRKTQFGLQGRTDYLPLIIEGQEMSESSCGPALGLCIAVWRLSSRHIVR